MNLLFLIPNNSFGGLEIQTVLRAKDALDRGYKSIIVALKGSRVEVYAISLGITVENINVHIKYIDIFASKSILKICKKHNINTIIVSKTEYLSISIVAKMISKTKLRVLLYQQMQSGINKRDFFHNWIYKNLSGVILLTNKMKSEIVKNTIINENIVRVIPCGIKLEEFEIEIDKKNENRIHFNLPLDKIIIGYVARVDENKDQILLIKAFSEVENSNKILVLCGSVENGSEEYFEKLIEEIESANIKDKVFILPFTNEIPKLMSTFDLFILTSKSETLGLVILEAMATALPVIATNSGGVPEIISDNHNGLLFQSSNLEDLKNKINMILKNTKLRNEIVNNAFIHSHIEYDYNIQANKFFEFCKNS